MPKNQEINPLNISELFKIIDSGISIVHNRIDVWIVGDKEKENYTKVWQVEKVSEYEYCYKTFDGYGKGIKEFFFLDSSKAEKPIEEYYQAFRGAFCSILSSIYGDEDMAKEIVSNDLLNYRGYTLNYTDKELLDDKLNNRLYKYKFSSFKTRQTTGSNKSGENAIREVLNTHIATKYPNGMLHDEYTTIGARSRADSVVFNMDSIHVYEIKSAKDSFTRLESQIDDYKKYADRITIVLDSKKMSAYIKNHAHKYKDVEVLQYFSGCDKLETSSRGKKMNATTDKMQLLWSPELKEQALYFISGISQFSGFKLNAIASKIFTKKQAHDIVHEILYTRHQTVDAKGKMNRGSVDMFKIFQKYKLNSEPLQKKADRIIDKFKRENI